MSQLQQTLHPLALLSNVYQALAHPNPQSWVWWISNKFGWMAVAIFAPVAFITVLDIAAYVIVRTLGAQWAHPAVGLKENPQVIVIPVEKDEITPNANGQRPDKLTIPSSNIIPSIYFNTPGHEGNDALAGAFSPPISRAGSPPILRARSNSQLGASIQTLLSASAESLDRSGAESDWDTMQELRKRKTGLAPPQEYN